MHVVKCKLQSNITTALLRSTLFQYILLILMRQPLNVTSPTSCMRVTCSMPRQSCTWLRMWHDSWSNDDVATVVTSAIAEILGLNVIKTVQTKTSKSSELLFIGCCLILHVGEKNHQNTHRALCNLNCPILHCQNDKRASTIALLLHADDQS